MIGRTNHCRPSILLRGFASVIIGFSVLGATINFATAATSKTIRVWGDDAAADALAAVEAAYRTHHPDIAFDNRLMGSDTGIAGLYTDAADIAILGRDIHPVETLAYTWVFKHGPVAVPIATGSLGMARHSPPVAVVVRADNSIDHISLVDLDALIGVERKRGAPAARSTWGDLGATGVQADHRIHVYLRNVEKSTATVIRDRVMQGSRKWRWDFLTEFDDRVRPGGQPIDADEDALVALEKDPDGMMLGRPPVGHPSLKAIAISDGSGVVPPTRATLLDGTYPLARTVMAYAKSEDLQASNAPVREFLAFLLSDEGQASFAGQNVFLPLRKTLRTEAIKRLPGVSAPTSP